MPVYEWDIYPHKTHTHMHTATNDSPPVNPVDTAVFVKWCYSFYHTFKHASCSGSKRGPGSLVCHLNVCVYISVSVIWFLVCLMLPVRNTVCGSLFNTQTQLVEFRKLEETQKTWNAFSWQTNSGYEHCSMLQIICTLKIFFLKPLRINVFTLTMEQITVLWLCQRCYL